MDEAAFVRNFDTLWTGLYPTLSTGGEAIILSTPNGVGGQYYDLYVLADKGENIFNPIKLQWDVHPERDQTWFELETKNMSEKQIAQELLCDFAASGETFLRVEDIEYIRNWICTPVDRWGPDMGVWVWEYPLSEKKYVISADVSRGDAGDYSTFHVIDTEASSIVAEYQGKLPPDRFAQLLAEAGRRYNDALMCPENNSYGYAVIMKLNELEYRNLYFQNDRDRYNYLYGDKDIAKIGFQTNSKTRAQILTKLEEVLRTKQVKIRSSRLYEELKTFVWKNGKAQAMKGQNDDLIMALAIGVWLYDTSPQLSKTGTDINKAMLAAFAVNSTPVEDTVVDQNMNKIQHQKKRVVFPGSRAPHDDFDWLK